MNIQEDAPGEGAVITEDVDETVDEAVGETMDEAVDGAVADPEEVVS